MLLAFVVLPTAAATETESELLSELDNAIAQRTILRKGKDSSLSRLKNTLEEAKLEKNFASEIRISEELWREYAAYDVDQALFFASEMTRTAAANNDREHVIFGTLHKAESLMKAGMFKEAYDILLPIKAEARLEPYRTSYYHICRSLYGYMADYTVAPEDRVKYRHKTNLYRDSVISQYKQNDPMYSMVLADKLIANGNAQQAISRLTPFKPGSDLGFNAAYYYTMGEAYAAANQTELAFEAYIRSATYDMLSNTREYISLRKVAIMLYRQGDIDRAYSYLSICLNDAKACNARLRQFEILDAFPVINQAYLAKQHQQRYILIGGIIVISILLVFSIFAFYRMKKQRNTTRRMQQELSQVNTSLQEVNNRLSETAREVKLQAAQIEESSIVKEIYIGRYMDQCSSYLERMDKFRRHLRKVAEYGTKQELRQALTSSSKEMEEELEEFYSNFDETFLGLFPTFVADFNKLLQPGEEIQLKPGQKMNTELRIFALIRLGITDSVKIAQFLRYSTTTIYNYRTRIRNKAKGNRDELEKQVANIGKVVSES